MDPPRPPSLAETPPPPLQEQPPNPEESDNATQNLNTHNGDKEIPIHEFVQEPRSRELDNFRNLVKKIALASAKNSSLLTHDQTSLLERRIEELFPRLHTPDHPPYAAMIETAIQQLNDEGGSAEEAISVFIKNNFNDLPWAHGAILKHHLSELCMKRYIYQSYNRYYLINDEEPERIPITSPAPASRAGTNLCLSPSSSPASESGSSSDYLSEPYLERRWLQRKRRKVQGRKRKRPYNERVKGKPIVRGRTKSSVRRVGRPGKKDIKVVALEAYRCIEQAREDESDSDNDSNEKEEDQRNKAEETNCVDTFPVYCEDEFEEFEERRTLKAIGGDGSRDEEKRNYHFDQVNEVVGDQKNLVHPLQEALTGEYQQQEKAEGGKQQNVVLEVEGQTESISEQHLPNQKKGRKKHVVSAKGAMAKDVIPIRMKASRKGRGKPRKELISEEKRVISGEMLENKEVTGKSRGQETEESNLNPDKGPQKRKGRPPKNGITAQPKCLKVPGRKRGRPKKNDVSKEKIILPDLNEGKKELMEGREWKAPHSIPVRKRGRKPKPKNDLPKTMQMLQEQFKLMAFLDPNVKETVEEIKDLNKKHDWMNGQRNQVRRNSRVSNTELQGPDDIEKTTSGNGQGKEVTAVSNQCDVNVSDEEVEPSQHPLEGEQIHLQDPDDVTKKWDSLKGYEMFSEETQQKGQNKLHQQSEEANEVGKENPKTAETDFGIVETLKNQGSVADNGKLEVERHEICENCNRPVEEQVDMEGELSNRPVEEQVDMEGELNQQEKQNFSDHNQHVPDQKDSIAEKGVEVAEMEYLAAPFQERNQLKGLIEQMRLEMLFAEADIGNNPDYNSAYFSVESSVSSKNKKEQNYLDNTRKTQDLNSPETEERCDASNKDKQKLSEAACVENTEEDFFSFHQVEGYNQVNTECEAMSPVFEVEPLAIVERPLPDYQLHDEQQQLVEQTPEETYSVIATTTLPSELQKCDKSQKRLKSENQSQSRPFKLRRSARHQGRKTRSSG